MENSMKDAMEELEVFKQGVTDPVRIVAQMERQMCIKKNFGKKARYTAMLKRFGY